MAATEHRWRVPTDHPALAGHFPGQPIVPGVVLLDQALLLAQAHLGLAAGPWQIGQAKFSSPCGPGDELIFELTQGARGGLAFTVRCEGRNIASGSLTPALP